MNSVIVIAFLILVGFAVLVAAIVVVSTDGGPDARAALVAATRAVARLVSRLG